jgi:hypothetical protein
MRWLPVHTVETIVLSVISILSSPNDESPANLEAAVGVFVELFEMFFFGVVKRELIFVFFIVYWDI